MSDEQNDQQDEQTQPKLSAKRLADTARQRESQNSLDAYQDAATGGKVTDPVAKDQGAHMNVPVSTGDATNPDQSASLQSVYVDHGAVELLDPSQVTRPKQVQPKDVIYMPRKDFEARVNQQLYYFKKDVPVRVPRDVANMLLEDSERGYVRD